MSVLDKIEQGLMFVAQGASIIAPFVPEVELLQLIASVATAGESGLEAFRQFKESQPSGEMSIDELRAFLDSIPKPSAPAVVPNEG